MTIADAIRKMPKIDLHCHLDGSLPVMTVKKLTGRTDLKDSDLQAERDCNSLKTYLEKFALPLEGMQTRDGLIQSARDFLMDLKEDGVIYVEVRFAPMLSVGTDLSCGQVIEAVIEGMRQGESCTGIKWQIICCAMRHHDFKTNSEMIEIASQYLGHGVCAVDLAGDEAAYPAKIFRPLFAKAKALGIPFTIHAGECGSEDNVRESIRMGAARIGHGIAMSHDGALMDEVAKRRIGIELCPTSNYQTHALEPQDEYPLKLFLDKNILVTINTDNRTVSQTTMSRELAFAAKLAGRVGEEAIELAEKLMENAVEASFLTEEEKAGLRSRLSLNKVDK
ncbi:MAG: adenosine deaminase [Clostridia bacterium]|nr:adenosine deaminase [Clostridia bacterium]NCC44152.1 adenosine deaminase [Clostridia bacterium]